MNQIGRMRIGIKVPNHSFLKAKTDTLERAMRQIETSFMLAVLEEDEYENYTRMRGLLTANTINSQCIEVSMLKKQRNAEGVYQPNKEISQILEKLFLLVVTKWSGIPGAMYSSRSNVKFKILKIGIFIAKSSIFAQRRLVWDGRHKHFCHNAYPLVRDDEMDSEYLMESNRLCLHTMWKCLHTMPTYHVETMNKSQISPKLFEQARYAFLPYKCKLHWSDALSPRLPFRPKVGKVLQHYGDARSGIGPVEKASVFVSAKKSFQEKNLFLSHHILLNNLLSSEAKEACLRS